MDDNTIYILSDELNSVIGHEVETMDSWLTLLSDEELNSFYTICNKNPDTRSGEEDYEITRHSLVIYCRELGLEELSITTELLADITGMFCVNVIVESMRRRGLVETEGPLMIYKPTKFSLTNKGKEISKESIEKEDE